MYRLKKIANNNEMLPEYDFSHGVRGKYTKRYSKRTNIVLLAPDVAKVFSTEESVNEALRLVIELTKIRSKTKKSSRKVPVNQE